MEALVRTQLTGDDLLKLPDDERYELIEGELIPMVPPPGFEHGRIESNAVLQLHLWNREQRLGRILSGEVGFYTRGDNRTVRAADVVFISYQRFPAHLSPEGYLNIPPELVIEVISPGNTAEEMEAKTREWLTFGVRMVWLIYPKTRRIHVYTVPDKPIILDADAILDGGDILPGFTVQVGAFFES